MRNIKYQQVLLPVSGASASRSFEVYTDKLYEKVTGVMIDLPYTNSLYGSTIEMSISAEELFPEGFLAKNIHSSQEVPPDERFYSGTKENPMQDEAKGSVVKGIFTDGGATSGVTFPYVAVLTLRLENTDEKRN